MFRQVKRNKRGAWNIVRVTVIALAVWLGLTWCMAQWLIVRSPIKHADAIVVLAGSGAYVERTQYAAELFLQKRAPKIILTNDNLIGGWSETEQRNPYFVERAMKELRGAGVPGDKIEVLSRPVSSTHDEAVLLREYSATHEIKALLFVTSAYHSRRALWTLHRVFQEGGVEVGLDAPPPGQQTPPRATWWCYLFGWRSVALEYPKLLYYWITYR